MLRNERGGVLVYVFFVFAVLMIFVPVLLMSTSTSALADLNDRNEKLANQAAISGIESLIAYLDAYGKGTLSRSDYYDLYPGFGLGPHTVPLPDGTPMTYDLETTAIAGTNQRQVVMTAAAGTGTHRKEKTLTYLLTVDDAKEGGGGNPTVSGLDVTTDPALRIPVSPDPERVYIGNSFLSWLNSAPDGVSKILLDGELSTQIRQAINDYAGQWNTLIQNYSSTAIECESCRTDNDITRLIASIPGTEPLIIKTNNVITIDSETSWGTSSRPVVLMLGGVNITTNYPVDVTGDLIITNNVIMTRENAGLHIHGTGTETPPDYGNLYVGGLLSAGTGFELSADNRIYAGNMTLWNNDSISAYQMVVNGFLTANTNVALHLTTDLITSTFLVNSNADINALYGDFFIENTFLAGSNAQLNTGGLIAAGSLFSMMDSGQASVNVGGSTTSLLIPGTGLGDGSSDGNSGTTESGWNPIRQ